MNARRQLSLSAPANAPGVSCANQVEEKRQRIGERLTERLFVTESYLSIQVSIYLGIRLCCTGLTASASTIYIEYNGYSFYHIMMMLMLAILTALMLPRVQDVLGCQKVFTVKATVVYPLSLLFYYDNSTYYCATIHWGCWGCPCSPLLQLQFVQCRKRSLSE